jgi:uncharacterized protein YdgA (DUF945 family)
VSKTTKILVIGLVVVCLAYPGFAWLIGLQVQASMLKREQQVMDQYPGSITIISRQYHRGVYGATEEVTYGFGAKALQALAPLGAISDVTALHLTVRNTIHHGPVPQFRTVALATFATQVELPPELSVKLRALLGGEPVIQIHGRLGWLGGATTIVASPGYEARLADGTQISWHNLAASSSANAALTSSSIDATLGSFEVKSAKFLVAVTGLQLRADMKRAFDSLYTGPLSLKVATVKWQSLTSSGQGSVQGLSIGGTGSAQGDYYKSAVQFGADSLQTSGVAITHAGYDISFEHLYGPTLVSMMKDARASGVTSGGATPASPAAALAGMKSDFIELLLHEPLLNISHLGFTMPEGTLAFSAMASAPGLKREDLEGPQVQAALMQHLKLVADVRIDAALASRLMAGNGRKGALAAQLDAFEHQGYIKRDGAALTAHLTFAEGRIAVNGQPYPPKPGP